jgi:uncharacterized spore protein YtfJ
MIEVITEKEEGLVTESEELIKTTVEEIEKILSTKTVVGEPTQIGDTTIIPLISVGFAFGAGVGTGKDKDKGEGSGSGGGGGGGVKPVAVLIIDEKGIRVEAIKGGMAEAIERAIDKGPEMVEKIREKKAE